MEPRKYIACKASTSSALREPNPLFETIELIDQIPFPIGPQITKDLALQVSQFQSPSTEGSLFLGLQFKSNRDGKLRDNRVLNSMVVVDAEQRKGASYNPWSDIRNNRMLECRQSVKLFYKKLHNADAFGLVEVSDKSKKVIECTRKSALEDSDVQMSIERISTTEHRSDLEQAYRQGLYSLQNYVDKKEGEEPCENRMVVLTFSADKIELLVDKIIMATREAVSTTVIVLCQPWLPIRSFDSKPIKGLRVVYAFDNRRLREALFESFDSTFFPCALLAEISLLSTTDIQIRGVHIHADAICSNQESQKSSTKEIKIASFGSVFPNKLELAHGHFYAKGNLTVLELAKPDAELTVKLSYVTLNGSEKIQCYAVNPIGKAASACDNRLRQALEALELLKQANTISKARKDSWKEEVVKSMSQIQLQLSEYPISELIRLRLDNLTNRAQK